MHIKDTGTKIGICGGTFDPVHHGHLILAENVREQFGLDRILFIPSGMPPHKIFTEVTDSVHRLGMLREAVKGNPYFEVSDIEVSREGYTYTVDTLQDLKSFYGDGTELYFVIGADVVFDILTWRNIERAFELCEFIAVLRPGFTENALIERIALLDEKYHARIHMVKAALIEISSTEIRQRLRQGRSIKYLVPEKVEQYIRKNELYL